MKRTKTAIHFVLVQILALAVNVFAEVDQKVQKTFDESRAIRLKLVLGECEIGASSDGKIHVDLVYSYSRGGFKPTLEERNHSLLLQEKFRGNNPRGYSRWTLAVPDGVEIDLSSATGDLTVCGVTADIEGKTGTGDLHIEKVNGALRLSTGTGRVEVIDSEGDFEVSSGTGRVTVRDFKGDIEASSGTADVRASGVILESEGTFSSGTGNAEVVFPSGREFDLRVNSGTGDALLDMNGQLLQGFFEFTCQAKRGRIVCSEKFDQEEEYTENKAKHLRKSFTRGEDALKIYLSTGTGKAKLMK